MIKIIKNNLVWGEDSWIWVLRIEKEKVLLRARKGLENDKMYIA